MRRLFCALVVSFLVISWLPAQSTSLEASPSTEQEATQLVSRLKIRLRTIGNGEVAIPKEDLDLIFAQLELVGNESYLNYSISKDLQQEIESKQELIKKQNSFKKMVPWLCLASLGAGLVIGCIGVNLVQK